MYLSKQEERTLEGEYGWASQVSMRILVRLGDLYGATKLIPVESAHLSGVSYKHMGDAAIDFLDELANKGGKAHTTATLNPASFDQKYLAKRYSRDRLNKQEHINGLYEKMLIKPTLTCTPYYLQKPKPSQHLAWAESSAVIYANSVLKAWTNREGAPSALAAALIGKTANYGFHQPENRQPNVLIKVEAELTEETDYGALGIHLGKMLKEKIPSFEGLKCSDDDLKHLGAAMASSGMTAMFHTQPLEKKESLETITIENENIEERASSLSTSNETPDLIFIGCPHCSLNEIKSAAHALEGKKVRGDAELWVCTSHYVKEKAKGYVNAIERAGGQIICDTCVLTTWVKDLGINIVMTNSAKTAFYAPTLNEVEVRFASLNHCVNAACSVS